MKFINLKTLLNKRKINIMMQIQIRKRITMNYNQLKIMMMKINKNLNNKKFPLIALINIIRISYLLLNQIKKIIL